MKSAVASPAKIQMYLISLRCHFDSQKAFPPTPPPGQPAEARRRSAAPRGLQLTAWMGARGLLAFCLRWRRARYRHSRLKRALVTNVELGGRHANIFFSA
jgi:hypothetical protein